MHEGSRTKPIGTIFGGPGKGATALEVESDSHESPLGIGIAVRTAVALLTELGCLFAEEVTEHAAYQQQYEVLAATMVPSAGYRFVSENLLESFAPITIGQTLLVGPQGDVCARHSGRLVFAPAQVELQPGDENEEVCFELGPCQLRHRSIRIPTWATTLT
jgi:hypothetical protein